MVVANTSAYHDTAIAMAIKSFMVQVLGVNIAFLFSIIARDKHTSLL
jgi:hypothetical protein